MVKPFKLEELKARIEAIYQRCSGASVKLLQVDSLQLNLDTCEVTREGKPITRTKNCYKLLMVLMKHSPAVVSRETLTYELWADEFPDSDSLKSHIYRLRQEIDKPFGVPLIHTVQGHGFRMAAKWSSPKVCVFELLRATCCSRSWWPWATRLAVW